MDFIRSFCHPEELLALMKFRINGHRHATIRNDLSSISSSGKICYDFLTQTSRSFAAVIKYLDGDLRHAVCIFYLVLRALDTIEDDMNISYEKKVTILKEFYTYLEKADWCFNESSEKDKIVLEQFPLISKEFRRLSPLYKEVISNTCKEMGHGMIVFLQQTVDTVEQWDEYCHYVAGLVGIGLTKLFTASGLEDPRLEDDLKLANSMGLFLQKVNIIRDYLEDSKEGREFWPKQVWKKHGKQLCDFQKEENWISGLRCLNELITNALQHVPDCLTYLLRLRNQSIFNFSAIPQVMAIATLQRCYNNINVLTGVVKLRKGEAVSIMMTASNMHCVNKLFYTYLNKINRCICSSDEDSTITKTKVSEILLRIRTSDSSVLMDETSTIYLPIWISFGILVFLIIWNYYSTIIPFYSKYIDSI